MTLTREVRTALKEFKDIFCWFADNVPCVLEEIEESEVRKLYGDRALERYMVLRAFQITSHSLRKWLAYDFSSNHPPLKALEEMFMVYRKQKPDEVGTYGLVFQRALNDYAFELNQMSLLVGIVGQA